jgi:phenylpropionate dioxygenase-like ring-hydroxylating dioxygenase large terminal subunit
MPLADVLVQSDGRVPKARYLSPEFARLEQERLWSRVWQIACREEELPEPGAFVEYEIGDQSILVVRGDDGAIRAFANACLHRGTRLGAGRGCFEHGTITCRYHAWQYALDGRLTHVVDAHEFAVQELAAIPEGLRLAAVRAECWGGFVFVNPDPGAEPLVEFLAPLPELLAPYHLEDMRLRAHLSTVLPANWKSVVDAFNESYHVQGTHPQILPWTDDTSIAYEQLGRHARYGRLAGARRELRPSPRLGLRDDEWDEGEILAGLVAGLGGAFLADERAMVDELRAADLPPGRLLPEYQQRRRDLLAARGLDVSGFEPDRMTSAEDVYCFPNVVGPIYPGSAILFRARPHGLDPDRALHDTWVLEWPRPGTAPRRVELRSVADGRDRDWGEITNQDYANMAEVQAGMKSNGFDALRLNPRQEANLLHMHRVIDGYLAG